MVIPSRRVCHPLKSCAPLPEIMKSQKIDAFQMKAHHRSANPRCLIDFKLQKSDLVESRNQSNIELTLKSCTQFPAGFSERGSQYRGESLKKGAWGPQKL